MISSSLIAYVASLLLTNKVSAAPLPTSATAEGIDIGSTLQNILANTQKSDAYTYPTDLTRGIMPVSHIPAQVPA